MAVEFTLNLGKMLSGETDYARAISNLTMFLKKLKPINFIEEQILDKWSILAAMFPNETLCFDYQLRAFEKFKKYKEFIPHLNTIAELYYDETGKLSLISKKGEISITTKKE